MKVGLVGKPNAGKSTFFTAVTSANAQIGDYPFTTIDKNVGIAHVRKICPSKELGIDPNPNNSLSINGIRYIPIEVIDVAGLVPGAHEGKGMGNKFLDDLRQADVLIQVVDSSGNTDLEGNDYNLDVVRDLNTDHHLAINASRAWGFHCAYLATSEKKWKEAYDEHVQASIDLHPVWKDDRRAYSHWVPQFTLYSMLMDN